MRRLLQLALFLLVLSLEGLLATPAWAQWTQVQSEIRTSCTSWTTCDLTVASTGTGNLIIGGFIGSNGDSNLTSITGGGTWVICSDCAAANGGTSWSVDLGWTLSSASGATTISFIVDAANSSGYVFAYEYACTGTKALDDSASTAGQSASTTPPGQALTLGGSGRLIVQTIGASSIAVNSISAPYTDLLAASPVGAAVSENTSSGSAPTWTLASSSITNIAAAAFSCTAPATGSGSRRSFGFKK